MANLEEIINGGNEAQRGLAEEAEEERPAQNEEGAPFRSNFAEEDNFEDVEGETGEDRGGFKNAFPVKRRIKNLKLLAGAGLVLILLTIGFIAVKKFMPGNIIPLPKQNSVSFKKPNFLLTKPSKSKPETNKSLNALNPVLIEKTPGKPAVKTEQNHIVLNQSSKGKRTVKTGGLNDLFKLKEAKSASQTAQVKPAQGIPPQYQVPAPSFNGLPPDVLQNIKSKINAGNFSINGVSNSPKVLGVSNNYAVIRYGGADLYLKTGASFGNCRVMGVSLSNVKIICGKTLKNYPVEFGGGSTNTQNNNTGVKK